MYNKDAIHIIYTCPPPFFSPCRAKTKYTHIYIYTQTYTQDQLPLSYTHTHPTHKLHLPPPKKTTTKKQVLQRLTPLLEPHAESASLVLTEKGEAAPLPRHPEFRLFAAMNPATDAGKKDLPPALRARFTEVRFSCFV